MFSSRKCDIGVGVIDNIDTKKRDGVAWCKSVNSGLTHKSFTVDKPELLLENDSNITKSVFDQLIKMGFLPAYVEVFANNVRRLYSYGCMENPIFIDSI